MRNVRFGPKGDIVTVVRHNEKVANFLFGQLQKRGLKNAGENTRMCDEVAGTVP